MQAVLGGGAWQYVDGRRCSSVVDAVHDHLRDGSYIDIFKRHDPGDCADTTAAGRKKLKAKLKQALARSSFLFEMVVRTYRNVRGKEFAARGGEEPRVS